MPETSQHTKQKVRVPNQDTAIRVQQRTPVRQRTSTVNIPVAEEMKASSSFYQQSFQAQLDQLSAPTTLPKPSVHETANETLVVPQEAIPQEAIPQEAHTTSTASLTSSNTSATVTEPVSDAATQERPLTTEENLTTEESPVTAGAPAGPATPESLAEGAAAAWMLAESEQKVQEAFDRSANLAKNQNKVTPASKKVKQSEEAVTSPEEENQASSNRGQVENLSEAQVDDRTAADAKNTLTNQLSGALPNTLEGLDNFKETNSLPSVNQQVKNVVSGDTAEVQASFGVINQQPQPAKGQKGQSLPGHEQAPGTPGLSMGAGVVPELPAEYTDVSSFVQQSDDILVKEGISQEHLDMVDSGDLAIANEERRALKDKAQTEPEAVKNAVNSEAQQVQADMENEENTTRSAMYDKRKNALNDTTGKQEKTKTELEKKREEVARIINQKYEDCQKRITKRLGLLEVQALNAFEKGQIKATEDFEKQVKRDIDAFKDRRYNGGLWGTAKQVKDFFYGIDKFPEVKQAFDNAREAYVRRIDQLVEDITAYNNRVIDECKNDLENTRAEIEDYVANLSPELKSIGEQSLNEMKQKLDELNEFINQQAEALQKKLAEKRKQAIEAIDKKIAEMKASMSGALNIIGSLLLNAAKKFFLWVLETAGFPPEDIMAIINKGEEVLRSIFTDPIGFIKNLIDAAITGFQNFGSNILSHLKNAVFNWLTGSLDGIQLPNEWNLQGILSVVLQIVGISWNAIRAKLVKLMGEPTVQALEAGFTLVKTLVTEGPMAAWEQLKEMAGDLKDAFIDAVKDFIKEKIVIEAVKAIVSALVPGAGFLKAIESIYVSIMWFVDKAKDIMRMVGDFLNSIGEIAAGNIDAAAAKLEGGLASGLTLVVSFLAKYLKLDGITKKIQKVIDKVRTKVDNALDKVVDWIKKKAKNLFGKKEDKKTEEEESNPEKQAKIDAAIIDLHNEEQKHNESDGSITLENAQLVAKVVKSKHPVFTSFKVVDGDDTWNYAYTASPERILEGPKQHDKEVKLIVGPHPLKGEGRESHHVPANQLSKAYENFYSLAIGALPETDEPSVNSLKDKLENRRVKAAKPGNDGTGLAAILIHQDTHRTGQFAVHRSSIQEDVLLDIKKNIQEANRVRVVVEVGSGKRLVANLSDEHWQAFLKTTYDLVSGESVDVVENGKLATVKLKEAKQGTTLIANKIADSFENIQEDDFINMKKTTGSVTKKINNMLDSSFESALENGISGVRVALKSSNLDGTPEAQAAALDDLRIYAQLAWNPIMEKL